MVAVLLVGGLVRDAGDDDATAAGASGTGASWSSPYGTNMRAGFMDGCRSNMRGAVDCRCLFSELTSRPAYSTPRGFAALATEMQATQQVPADYMRALDSCRVS